MKVTAPGFLDQLILRIQVPAFPSALQFIQIKYQGLLINVTVRNSA